MDLLIYDIVERSQFDLWPKLWHLLYDSQLLQNLSPGKLHFFAPDMLNVDVDRQTS